MKFYNNVQRSDSLMGSQDSREALLGILVKEV